MSKKKEPSTSNFMKNQMMTDHTEKDQFTVLFKIFNESLLEQMYTTLVLNRVYVHGNVFYCYICKEQTDGLAKMMVHILTDYGHNERILIGKLEKSELTKYNINELKCAEYVHNGIVLINLQLFSCNICLCKIPSIDHVGQHITGLKHKNKLLELLSNGNVLITVKEKDVNKDQILNILDNKQVTDNKIINTTDKEQVIEKKITVDVNTVSKQNSISPASSCVSLNSTISNNNLTKVELIEVYYCNFCNIILFSSPEIRYHQMFHLRKPTCLYSHVDIIEFSIKNLSSQCIICQTQFLNEKQLSLHLNSQFHKNVLKFFNIKEEIKLPIDISDPFITSNGSQNANIYKTLYCELCNAQFNDTNTANDHINGKKHKKKVVQLSTEKKTIILKSIPKDISLCYTCFLCNFCCAKEDLLFKHYNTEFHKIRIAFINIVINDKKFKFVKIENGVKPYCTLCQKYYGDLQECLDHVCILESLQCTTPHNENTLLSQDKKINLLSFSCNICNVNVNRDHMLLQHLQSKRHNFNKTNVDFTGLNYKCQLCNISFTDESKIIDHFSTEDHKKLLDPLISNKNDKQNISSKTSQEKLNVRDPVSSENVSDPVNSTNASDPVRSENVSNSVSSENVSDPVSSENVSDSMSSVNVNEVLDKLINFKIEKINKNIPSKTNSTCTSKNSGIIKCINNLKSFGNKYVELCLEPGTSNIYNTSSSKIDKLEYSLKLTVPLNSTRFCFICGIGISNNRKNMCDHFESNRHIKNLEEMKKHHKSFEQFEDQFSDLDLAQMYMVDTFDETIKCLACNDKINNLVDDIKLHVKSKDHIEKCYTINTSTEKLFTSIKKFFNSIWYYAENFICQPCNQKFDFEINFAKHLQDNHFKINKSNLENYVFDFCSTCVTFWYGKANGYSIHCKEHIHEYLLNTKLYQISDLNDLVINILKEYNKEIKSLLELSNSIDHNAEEELVKLVENMLKVNFPNVKAYLFGSRLSKLGLPDSDIDIYIDINNDSTSLANKDCKKLLLEIEKCFSKADEMWIIEEVILNATVPILKVKHRLTGFCCDISCSNGLSVTKSKLIMYYCLTYPVCRKLILYMKMWISLCRLSGSQGINTYTISCLVIYFLQLNGIVPNVYKLKYPVHDFQDVPDNEVDHLLLPLLKGFFLHYAQFNYITDVICPYLGKCMHKRLFIDINHLPSEMEEYKKLYNSGEVEIFRIDSPFCVQDPIDLSQNLTKAIKKTQIRSLQKYCQESVKILDDLN